MGLGGLALYLQSISHVLQILSMNSCLFSTYPIALTGKADSQEDAHFSIAPFMSSCDSGFSSSSVVVGSVVIVAVISAFAFLCHILLLMFLAYCWSEGFYLFI